ncbi:MAG: hypothetical protein KA004_17930 [Verrucomicrobiales bacterium]|nr:hypothetical protein [Verrucomicrobiales bacterium]
MLMPDDLAGTHLQGRDAPPSRAGRSGWIREFTGRPAVRRAGWLLLAWSCILLPAVVAARLLYRNVVNFPFLDDFMFTEFLEKTNAGTLTLHDFFKVQMEHRLAWPRLVIFTLHHLAPGQFHLQCWVTYGLILLTVLNVGLLLRRTGRPFARWWPLLACTSLAFFSPVQYQILLWPMMFQVVSPVWGLTSAMVVLSTKWPLWLRFPLCVSFALVATLSLASGLLVWLLLVPVILFADWLPQGKRRWTFAALWLAAFAVTVALYFHGLKNETDAKFAYRAESGEVTVTKGLSKFLHEPGVALTFVLRFSGASLARGTSIPMLTAAQGWGILLAGVWVAVAVACLRRHRNGKLLSELVPWLMFGAYTIGTGFLVSLGRAWASKSGDNALQSRYICHAVPLTVAVMVLVWLLVSRLGKSTAPALIRTRMAAGAGALLMVGMQMIQWWHGAVMMEAWSSSRMRAAANALFFKIAGKPYLLNAASELCPNMEYASRLDDMGLLPHPMFKDTRLDHFTRSGKELSSNTAVFRELRPLFNDREPRYTMLAEGYASLPGRKRVPDALIFTYQEKDSPRQIFHVAQNLEMPLFLKDSLGRDMRFLFQHTTELSRNLTRFATEIPFNALPGEVEEAKVQLWVLDYRKWLVHPVVGDFRIRVKDRRIINLGPVRSGSKSGTRAASPPRPVGGDKTDEPRDKGTQD